MLLDGLRHRAKNNANLRQLFLIGRGDGNTVEHGIDGDPGQSFLLPQGNAQFFIGGKQFRIDFIETFGAE